MLTLEDIKYAKSLIRRDKLEEAINFLYKKTRKDELLLLSAQLERAKKAYRENLIDYETYDQIRSKVAKGLIEVLNELEDELAEKQISKIENELDLDKFEKRINNTKGVIIAMLDDI